MKNAPNEVKRFELENVLTDYLAWKDKTELLEGLNAILDHLTDPGLIELRGPVDHVFIYGLDIIRNLTMIIQDHR